MKTRNILMLIALMISASILKAQPQPELLNLPGDNLNLYAVMKVFQESETLELFEKKLNEEDSRINNLDLNGDNYIDYIKVIDYVEKNVHYIVLQVAVTATENQDVAVFVVKKDPEGKVVIQLIGDEALYGKYYIVEPYYDTDKETPNPGYYGNYNNNNTTETVVVHHTTYYEVAAWPLVRFIYLPSYVAWHSPWYWGYYPVYWRPWTPWYWHHYYGYHYHWHHHYYGHYHHGHHNRFDNWNDVYYGPRRKASTTVSNRQSRGEYSVTYSKPETIRDGSSYFKKSHPDKVKAGMKDPDIKDIRTADKLDRKTETTNPAIKTNGGRKEDPAKNWSKPAKVENGSKAVKEEKRKNTSAKATPTKTETKNTVKSEKKESVKKEESKSQNKTNVKESSGKSKSETKKSEPKKDAGSDRSGRK
ncbi:MAG: hypothetical protein AB9842_09195 [Bacteroidales bacterium]